MSPIQPFSFSRLPLFGTLTVALLSAPAQASGGRAGTIIENVATATYGTGTQATTLTSNTVSLTVDEVLDLTVSAADSGSLTVAAGAKAQVRTFTITNVGNGPEAFTLNAAVVAGGDFAPTISGLAVDIDGNGLYDGSIDRAIAAGETSLLEPDAAATIFVLSDVPDSAADAGRAELRLTATAKTGSGMPGTVFTGQGEGGGDAVVGATTATSNGQGGFTVSRAGVTLTKSANVLDPWGGPRIVPGAVVTYTIVAATSGSGAAPALIVSDAIPEGTVYQPGTLSLDTLLLSDASDADAGHADASGIAVALGDATAGTSHRVEFKVKIK